ncbi:MAG: Trk family potassium uptake protein [Clostridia bacterium]|nr:Trk family potassium uptake protein [Clostridia bacterium]
MFKHKHRLTHIQIISLGYLVMIAVGTGLLMLPAASASGISEGFETALFTSTSASCVTGLILKNTGECWSVFGQAVILALIQIGGLGFITIATGLFIMLNRRMGLHQRETMVESINFTKVDGIMRLSGRIIRGTLIFEGAGAVLLALRFIPEFGAVKGIWYGVFHSVSAFCNAGFDILGSPGGSLTYFNGDILVNAVVICLIVIGGLGFVVWSDIGSSGFRFRRYGTHTKIVLTVTALLLFGGAALFFIFEKNFTGSGGSTGTRILEALFASATARTAGFNTVEISSMSGGSKLLSIALMFVGGSPGSTAGGIKTTTVAVLAVFALSRMRGVRRPHVFGRCIPEEAVKKSASVFLINLAFAVTAALIICGTQPFEVTDVLFETFSAVGTVGMTTGITPELSHFARYLIAFLMFIGRVGSVSFSMAILEKRKKDPVTYPEAEITVG